MCGNVDWSDTPAVHLHGYAPQEQLYGENQKVLGWLDLHEQAFNTGKRATADLHALPFTQIWMWEDRQFRPKNPLNRLHLRVVDHCGPVPSFSKDSDYSPGLQNLDVALPVQDVTHEQITGEHRGNDRMPNATSLRPGRHHRQEDVKPLRDQMLLDEPLAVAVRPERKPSGVCGGSFSVIRRNGAIDWQGFVPFGRALLPESRTCGGEIVT